MNHGFRFAPYHRAFALLAVSVVLGGSLQHPAVASPGDHPPHSSPAPSPSHPPDSHSTPDHSSEHPSNQAVDQASGQADHSSQGHHHEALEIPEGQPVPTVQIVVHPDAKEGWNLEIQTTDFRFAPELINQANQPGTGHGHLYFNGEKQGRVYGHWLHVAQLPPGANTITVSLNANSHEALTHQGQPIVATVVIEVPD